MGGVMNYETVAPKFISVMIFWSFFILIICFSMLTRVTDKCRWYLRYARVSARACRRR